MTRWGGSSIVVKGRNLVDILDSMDTPLDEARSAALFEQMMVRLAEQERERQRVRSVARTVGAVCAMFASARAGAFRLFTPPEPQRPGSPPGPRPMAPLKVVETTRRHLLAGSGRRPSDLP
jgi:hypothetical protein